MAERHGPLLATPESLDLADQAAGRTGPARPSTGDDREHPSRGCHAWRRSTPPPVGRESRAARVVSGNRKPAIDHLNLSDDSADWMGLRHHRGYTGRLRALAEADLGLVEQARSSAAVALAGAEEMSDREWKILTLGVLGRLELMLGDVEAALGYLREVAAQLLSTGYEDPTAPLWADAIEALIAGRRARTCSQLPRRCTRRSAERVGSPWALASAARCRGLLAAAEGDPPRRRSRPSIALSPSSTDSPALPARARPYLARSWHRAPAGAAEDAWPGRRSARRWSCSSSSGAALGGAGPWRAGASAAGASRTAS